MDIVKFLLELIEEKESIEKQHFVSVFCVNHLLYMTNRYTCTWEYLDAMFVSICHFEES